MNHSNAIQLTADRFTAMWRGCPPVTVVPNVRSLPFSAPADTEASYRDQHVHLVADALWPERAARVLGHEVIGHHGLRQHFGSSWRGFMTGVLRGTRTDPSLARARLRVESIYVDDAGEINIPAVHIADEVSAALVEQAMNPVTGRLDVAEPLKKQAAAIQGHLAREWLYLDSPVDRAQLEGALLAAERQLRHGGTFLGLKWRLGRWYAGWMAHKFDPKARPMSLAESKQLLKAHGEWRRMFGDLGMVFVFIAALVGLVWGVFASFENIGTLLRWIFH